MQTLSRTERRGARRWAREQTRNDFPPRWARLRQNPQVCHSDVATSPIAAAGPMERARLRGLVRDGASWLQSTSAARGTGGRRSRRFGGHGDHGAADLRGGGDHDSERAGHRDVRRSQGSLVGGIEPSRGAGGRHGLSRGLCRPVRTGAQWGRPVGRDGWRRCGTGLAAERRTRSRVVRCRSSRWTRVGAFRWASPSSGGWRAPAPSP